jgi:hypothetical protein
MTTEAAPRKCFSCGFETTSAIRRCPECNRGLRTSQQVRVLGMVLVVIGAGLSAGMAYLIWIIANIMRNRGGGAASSFTGTPRDAAFIFGILGLVLAIGVTSVSTGLWQVIFGRPNRLLSMTALALGLVTVALAVLFQLKG